MTVKGFQPRCKHADRLIILQVRLVDAEFLWTEPHSRRIKVKITIEKQLMKGTILQQAFVVLYKVQNLYCEDCHRGATSQTWNATVQVRQRVPHKRTFLFLEQLILRHNAHENTLSIKSERDGLDFFFKNRSHAVKFVDFLRSVVPVRSKTSKQLVSADLQNMTYNYKHTFCTEIVPLCKDDLVCLPTKLANSLGTLGNIALVWRVSTTVHVIDPLTLRTGEISGEKYYKSKAAGASAAASSKAPPPFKAVLSKKALREFIIMDVEPVVDAASINAAIQQKGARRRFKRKARRRRNFNLNAQDAPPANLAGGSKNVNDDSMGMDASGDWKSAGKKRKRGAGGQGFHGAMTSRAAGGKFQLALVTVARSSDLESGDPTVSSRRFTVKSHLGRILRVGDKVLG